MNNLGIYRGGAKTESAGLCWSLRVYGQVCRALESCSSAAQSDSLRAAYVAADASTAEGAAAVAEVTNKAHSPPCEMCRAYTGYLTGRGVYIPTPLVY